MYLYVKKTIFRFLVTVIMVNQLEWIWISISWLDHFFQWRLCIITWFILSRPFLLKRVINGTIWKLIEQKVLNEARNVQNIIFEPFALAHHHFKYNVSTPHIIFNLYPSGILNIVYRNFILFFIFGTQLLLFKYLSQFFQFFF